MHVKKVDKIVLHLVTLELLPVFTVSNYHIIVIDSSINEWRRRLECVVKNGGGHIEHCNLA